MRVACIYPELPALCVAAINPDTGYPLNWLEISHAMKDWAGWKCENCHHRHDPENGYTLTVHHLDGDPTNNDPRNLLVACQRCHLSVQATYIPGQIWLIGRPLWAEVREL
ncbi:MAG: HNH endonuclease [Chloroflexota bacterium]